MTTDVRRLPINQGQQRVLDYLAYNVEGIQGPPGTGKSTMIAWLFHALPPNAAALVTCVQNRAVDAVADKLARANTTAFIVHGNPERLGPVAKQWVVQAQVERDPLVVEAKRLQELFTRWLERVNDKIRSLHQRYFDDRRRAWTRRANALYPLSEVERNRYINQDRWGQLIRRYLCHPLFFYRDQLRKLIAILGIGLPLLREYAGVQIIRAAKAVLSTVDSVSALTRRRDLEKLLAKVTTAIIDEAGTCSEAKVPVILCLPRLRRLIAVGDQKQLQPFSYLGDSSIRGGGGGRAGGGRGRRGAANEEIRGLFHRLDSALGGGALPMLTDQYRMHPVIAKFVSYQFYNGLVQTPDEVCALRREQTTDANALVWINSRHPSEREQSPPESQSRMNLAEAAQLADWLHKEHLAHRLDGKSIMVITFYRAQLKVLREKLRAVNLVDKAAAEGYDTPEFEDENPARAGSDEQPPASAVRWMTPEAREDKRIADEHMTTINSLRIITVDQAQGSEADWVVLSCVRSNDSGELGFITKRDRANVSISRARQKLVVFGDPETLSSDTMWRELYQFATVGSELRRRLLPEIPAAGRARVVDDEDFFI